MLFYGDSTKLFFKKWLLLHIIFISCSYFISSFPILFVKVNINLFKNKESRFYICNPQIKFKILNLSCYKQNV